MALIDMVIVKNYRCFRHEIGFDLNSSTYFIGTNNAGKSTVLKAIRCFFNESIFSKSDINRAELLAKQAGHNKSEITIRIKTNAIQTTTRQRSIKASFPNSAHIMIKKIFTYKEASDTIEIQTFINDVSIQTEDANLQKGFNTVLDVLSAVAVSYIHPQEGIELLTKAQEKFKSRLFQNWGRHSSVATQIKEVETHWNNLRDTANSYLSAALTHRLQKIWPESKISINLPQKIEDVVAISDISFKSSPTLPEITLTDQGTGVQSTVLYQTHYILDSDKSLHKGQYYPIWLLEEPESFLHADIATQLGLLLNSDEWLAEIQMIISSHSPLILATSQQNKTRTNWVILEEYLIRGIIRVEHIHTEILEVVGKLLGDPNFSLYFEVSNNQHQIFIEDTKSITIDKYLEAGIEVTKALNGTPEIKQLLTLTSAIPELIQKSIILIIDADKGLKDFKQYLTSEPNNINGFKHYQVKKGLNIITLPENTAVEHLFDEFETVLEESVKAVFDENMQLKKTDIDYRFLRFSSKNKGNNPPKDINEAKEWMQNCQEVKDVFWEKVKEENFQFNENAKISLNTLIRIAQELSI